MSAHLDADDRAFPWPIAYLALSAASLALFLAVLYGVPGFAAIPLTVTVALIVLAFAVAAIAQYYAGRRDGPTLGR